jgi:glycyl-tRNA synthetase
VGKWCHLDENELRVARRAAHLCKADLATKMVVEMTSLQGLMGKYYALARGESPEVAEAIGEHYLPRFAGDTSPKTRPGLAVGVADRLDTLTGLFAAGLAPSGNKDPFALRRAGLGLVQNLVSWEMDCNLHLAIQTAAQYQPISATEENLFACRNFIIERLRNWLQDRGYRYDVVDAVLVEQGDNPATASRAVGELSNWVNRSDWRTILPAYARCVRITRDLTERYPVLEERFNTPAEKNLYAALLQAETQPRRPGSVDDFLNAFLPMIPRVTRFFDEVLVMAEDGELRQNRLGLLQRICSLAEGVADMSRLEGF